MRKILLLMMLLSTVFTLSSCKPDETEELPDVSWLLLIVGNDDSYGLINQQNEVIVPIEYEQIVRLGTYYLAEKDSSIYLFDKAGEQVFTTADASIPEEIDDTLDHYQHTDLTTETIIPFVRNNHYGFVDMTGAVVIEPTYYYAESFIEEYGIIYAIIDSFSYPSTTYTRGYIDIDSNVVIPFDSHRLSTPEDGRIRVGRKISGYSATYEYGFYNTEGELVIDVQYEEDTRDFKAGFAVVELDNDLGLIDTEGNVLLDPIYYTIIIYDKIERIKVREGGTTTFYDFNMNEVTGFFDNSIYNFTGNTSTFTNDGTVGVIDKDANILFSVDGDRINRTSIDGEYFTVYDETEAAERVYRLYDIDGNLIMSSTNYIDFYHNGIAITLTSDYKYNLITKEGDILLENKDIIQGVVNDRFTTTIFHVRDDSTSYFVDEDGTTINDQTYSDTSLAFELGLIAVCQNDKWGYINDQGEIIIPLEYDFVESFYFISGI